MNINIDEINNKFPVYKWSGVRFDYRTYNNGLWEVYGSSNFEHLCECLNEQSAELITNSLNETYK